MQESPLPTMIDLDGLEVALNNIDRVLADLELNAAGVPEGQLHRPPSTPDGLHQDPARPTPWR